MSDRPIFASRRKPRAQRDAVAHANSALLFLTDGTSAVEQGNEWSLERGDVLLVPAGERHRFARGDGESWTLGFFASSLIQQNAADLVDPFDRVRRGGSAVVHIPTARHEFLESLFRELETATDSRVQTSLLTLILNEVREASTPNLTRATGLVADALAYIERHCLRALTLNEVAAAVGRTPAHVTTEVRRATGRTVVEWIIEGRMAEARRLLLHSDEMVDVIAERVGYADPTHFIRMFRRQHGVTPRQWRSDRG